ncbi:MAG: transglutaminase family protein [Planctomycetaceae bacterium]
MRCFPVGAFIVATAIGAALLGADEKVPRAADGPAEQAAALVDDPKSLSLEQLTEAARRAVVVISVSGRDGKQQGLGSGFVVSADGLIATNLHVIGEARPISVQLADGRRFQATVVEASDRPLDLALVRIAAKDLPALPLGDSQTLRQGQPVVALGNPQGLALSVVAGVVSGVREIDGRQMIQLAIPIEPGNSGGPLLDRQGRVQGILTMKSAVTENLGFAMPVNALKPLIDKPNPTPISRWLTIGALDPQAWTSVFGARWRQRAGRILVDGAGTSFGGRALCLSETRPPGPPYEVAVKVKLDREEGAAGLVFCADGSDVHYGYYPSGGRLRLTRFDGPDVFSWHVLAEVQNDHYRPGDWNALKVRFEWGKIQCFINDYLAIESADAKLADGRAGLAKFRTTEAEFRGFRVDRQIPPANPADETLKQITALVDQLPATSAQASEYATRLAEKGPAGVSELRDRARRMETQARELRQFAQIVHQRRVEQELVRALSGDEAAIDLFKAALLVSLLDNDEVDVEVYRREVERMAREINASLKAAADEAARLTALNRYLFEELGFHGSRGDYYHRSNSYVNEVLDDREGLPITLAVIYLELAQRLGLNMVGVAAPGHFLVRHEPPGGPAQLIDVFDRGAPLSQAAAEERVREAVGGPARATDFAAATKRTIVVRILHNLLSLAQRSQDTNAMLRYCDCIIAISPDAWRERWLRAMLAYGARRFADASRDVDWLLQRRPQGLDLNQVDDLRRALEQAESR